MTSLYQAHLPTVLTILTGGISHLLFNRREPRSLARALLFLLGPPTALTIALRQFHPKLPLPFSVFGPLYLGALITSVFAYRLSPFHPLAPFPGPVICKITRLWALYIVETGQQHRYYQSLHARYGTHVRTGPNRLHICDAAAIQTVLGPKGFPRSARYNIKTSPHSQGSLIHLMDVHTHATRRQIWDRGMNSNALQEYQGMLATRVNQLVEAIEIQDGELDLSMWLSCFSFDFMGDITFGGPFNLLKQGGDPDGYTVMGRQNAKSFERFGALPWIKIFQPFLLTNSRLRRLVKFAEDNVIARMARGSAIKDIFYYLLDEGLGSDPLSLPTLTSEATLAIGAASDKVGAALANIMFTLISRPDIFDNLRAEIDEAFPDTSDGLTPAILAKLKYLNAVINETLRLWPVVPGGTARLVPRSNVAGEIIAGRWVPCFTTVQVHTYSLHRDSRYFSPDSDAIRPERWLDPSYTHNHAAYLPFSYGPMNCPGENVALQELRMVTAALVRKFEFRFAPGWDSREWEQNLHDIFVLSTGRLPVWAKPSK